MRPTKDSRRRSMCCPPNSKHSRPHRRARRRHPSKPRPHASTWSTAPIDLKALRAVDLDLGLAVSEVKFGQLPLANARVKAMLDNGELSANIDRHRHRRRQRIGRSEPQGARNLHDAAIALKLQNVDAEPITAELSGKPLLKGARQSTSRRAPRVARWPNSSPHSTATPASK